MKRFLSQPALRDFITLQNSAKPHLLLRNALALSHQTKVIDFYEQTLPSDIKHLSDQELFGVLRAYLQSLEHRNIVAAQDLIENLEKRKYADSCDLEIQKLILCSGKSIENVVVQFKKSLWNLETIPQEKRAKFITGFFGIICGTYQRLEAGLMALECMLEKEIYPTPELILILLKNTTAVGDVKTAMELIKRIESGEFGFELDSEMVVQAAKTVAREGDVTQVAHMLEYLKINQVKQHKECLTALMMAHENSGYLDGVVKMYRQVRRLKLAPSNEMLEILMRSYANDNVISRVIGTYGLGEIVGVKPSLEMHKIIMQAHFKLKEDIVAWNRCFNALYTINGTKDHDLWSIPNQLLSPIAQNAQGKHIAYVLERITLGELPRILYPKFITTLMSHLVSKDSNDPNLALLLGQTLLPGGKFENLKSSESQLSFLICMAKLQTNELNEAREIFDKNLDTWSATDKYRIYSELVSAYLRNKQVQNAVSVFLEAQTSGYVSSSLLESILQHIDKLDSSTLQNLDQISIDSGCIPCPKNEPLLYKRMCDMNAYGRI